ncbi:MAG TPA: TCP-1/cpn60 chaperonin family protein [Candidatus Sulfotelmatobacter sp.]|jgi:chaperonin GroEL (HSP60 family)|nr:TCP-1/cpn60 chaperonin family protein [Candidatus Sulfotelmatobacter sp.]
MAVTQQLLPATPQILLKNRGRLSGKNAWRQNLNLASLAALKIASSLGPKGAYKLVTYHRGPEMVMKVTKDPLDVVDELGIEYPAIMTLAEAAKIQRNHVGDGIATLLVLVSSLLTEADKLIEIGFHPNTILDGYLKATDKSVSIMREVATNIERDLDEHLLEVVDCGRDLLDHKLRRSLSEAIKRITDDELVDIDKIRIVKKPGGQTRDSELVRGVIIKQGKAHPSMPDWIDAPKIAFLSKLEVKRMELKAIDKGPFAARLNITSQGQIQQFRAEEAQLRARFVDMVKRSGANVLICRAKMADRFSDLLSRQGIFATHFVDPADFEAAAEATGGTIVANADQLTRDDLGTANKLEVGKIKPIDIVILHCERGATLLLRAGTSELLRELEKTVKRGLLILKHARVNPEVLPGGGAIFVQLALRLRRFALTFEGRDQFVIGSFADALEKIPECLACNYGLDPIDTMIQLRNYHSSGRQAIGLGEEGCVDMSEKNIIELGMVSRANIHRAYELVSLLLRIDDCFYVKDIPKFHKQ